MPLIVNNKVVESHPARSRTELILNDARAWKTDLGSYWLDDGKPEVYNSSYFRKDSSVLHESSPTWFKTAKEARAAAKSMGFKVKPGSVKHSGRQ